jgi:hypothetical protein
VGQLRQAVWDRLRRVLRRRRAGDEGQRGLGAALGGASVARGGGQEARVGGRERAFEVPRLFATAWTSKSATLRSLHGRFLVVGDAILSAYESATARYRGQDTILRRDERHYSARGALFDGGRLISAWAVELRLA